MITASLDAADGPLTDESGIALDRATLSPRSTSCQESGARSYIELDFATEDNATSRDHIVAAWDAAGYRTGPSDDGEAGLPVPAGADVRSSDELPIRQMSIVDAPDGLIHLTIESQCGMEDAAASAIPSTTPEEADSPSAQAPANASDMIAASIAAAVSPVTDAAGHVFDLSAVAADDESCGDGGSQTTSSLAFATGDNATTLARILGVWDAAGYLPDNAMHEDIRYSAGLPVDRMTIHDTSTIDGLIHMTVISRCQPPQ